MARFRRSFPLRFAIRLLRHLVMRGLDPGIDEIVTMPRITTNVFDVPIGRTNIVYGLGKSMRRRVTVVLFSVAQQFFGGVVTFFQHVTT